MCKECHKDESGGSWGLRGGFTDGTAKVELFELEDLSFSTAGGGGDD